jgi:flagellar motor switch protein FliM
MDRSEVLTQEEIDALLTGVSAGDVSTDEDYHLRDNVARPIDLTAHERIVRGRMPTLEMIGNRFNRSFRVSLFNLFRRTIDVSFGGVRMVKFGEYVHGLRVPTSLNLLRMQPLRGIGLVAIDARLVFSLVNAYFGGDPRIDSRIEGREFTPMESRVIQMTLERLLKDMADAWSPVLQPEFEYLNSEVNPQFANIVNPTEVVVVTTFLLDVEGAHGEIHLTLPYAMLEPIREMLDAGMQSDREDCDERWASTIRGEIENAEVEVHAALVELQLPLGRLLAIRAGDVIPAELMKEVVLCADNVPLFEGTVGVLNGCNAVQITRRCR